MTDRSDIVPGKTEFSCTLPIDGHFEKGRWVTFVTPILDAFRDEPYKEPTFDFTLTYDIPQFRNGACVGYKQGHVVRTFSRSDIEIIRSCEEISISIPGCLPQVSHD